MNNISKLYYKKIRKAVPVMLISRIKYLNYIKKMLADYEKEHSSFSYDDLVADLGEPKEIGDRKLLSLDADSLRRNMRIRKAILYVVAAATVIIIGITVYAFRDGIHQTVYIVNSDPYEPVYEEQFDIFKEEPRK